MTFPVRRILRVMFVPLLVVAMTGPWMYESINVPAPHRCAAPYVRLDDDFCGTPFSIGAYYPSVAIGLAGFAGMLIRGEVDAASIGFLSVMVLLALPLFTALLAAVRTDGRARYLNAAVLLLAFSAVLLFFSAERAPGQVMLWGPWLYLALTGGLLGFEVLVHRLTPGQAA